MRTFMEEAAGIFVEILDFEITKINKIGDRKFWETTLELLKFSLHTKEGFEYVALVNPSSWVEIRNLQDRRSSDPFHQGVQQEIGRNIGCFMTSFWGNAIEASDVQKFIKKYIQQTWLEMAERSVKEISTIHFACP